MHPSSNSNKQSTPASDAQNLHHDGRPNTTMVNGEDILHGLLDNNIDSGNIVYGVASPNDEVTTTKNGSMCDKASIYFTPMGTQECFNNRADESGAIVDCS
eukprot:11145706-Ditylum_brightwellii.AAC.1